MKRLICLIVIAAICFFTGRWLTSIYGFDPPYFVFYSGLILEETASIAFVSGLLLLLFRLAKSQTNTDKTIKLFLRFIIIWIVLIPVNFYTLLCLATVDEGTDGGRIWIQLGNYLSYVFIVPAIWVAKLINWKWSFLGLTLVSSFVYTLAITPIRYVIKQYLTKT